MRFRKTQGISVINIKIAYRKMNQGRYSFKANLYFFIIHTVFPM